MSITGDITSFKELVAEFKEYFFKYEQAVKFCKEDSPEFKSRILGMYLGKAFEIIEEFEQQNKEIQNILRRTK